MSLRRLMWHFFSVVRLPGTQFQDASFNREDCIPLYTNLRCHIQGVDKEDVLLEFGMKNRRSGFCLFHLNQSLEIDERCRIITSVDYRDQFDFTDASYKSRIFDFKGKREPVVYSKRQVKLEEIYMEENFLWEF